MIHYMKGDIFSSTAKAFVNPVNCSGVMGKGLAAEFKRRWPEMFRSYRKSCEIGMTRPGRVTVWAGDGVMIFNFPTKDDWKNPSTYEYVEEGLESLRDIFRSIYVERVAVPALGCGLGGLEWKKVRPLIETYLGEIDFEIEIYEPMENN